VSLKDLGRHAEALEYMKQALEIDKAVLGEKHPSVAGDYNNIGTGLTDTGKHAEALEYLKQALAIWKEVLGEKHPHGGQLTKGNLKYGKDYWKRGSIYKGLG
jgi:tetratricopeptide (TPR) repeat protein